MKRDAFSIAAPVIRRLTWSERANRSATRDDLATNGWATIRFTEPAHQRYGSSNRIARSAAGSGGSPSGHTCITTYRRVAFLRYGNILIVEFLVVTKQVCFTAYVDVRVLVRLDNDRLRNLRIVQEILTNELAQRRTIALDGLECDDVFSSSPIGANESDHVSAKCVG